jgi:signal transduction histidine kinase
MAPLAPSCPLGGALASRIRAAREPLAARWLERIAARVAVDREELFPTEELLNHVPLLLDGIADYLEFPDRDLDTEVPVTAKARELGALRYAQGFDAHQVLREQELLAGIVSSYLAAVVDEIEAPSTRGELAACWNRLAQAMELIRQATTAHFLQLAARRVREREDRLRRFNRMVSHELKNHLSAIRGAAGLLSEPWVDDAQRGRFVQMVQENTAGLQRVLENLEQLSRLEADTRQQRNILLPHVAAEVVRRLRDAATARDVEVRVSPSLPAVEVNAAAVELALVNYVSNAIKYSDSAKPERWVAIDAELLPPGIGPLGGELVVRVRDNGIGVPPSARADIFRQFYRAHEDTVTGVEGTGLGLSIVRETVQSMGGRAWAEFPDEGGSVFAFALPSRREEDAAAAGVTRAEPGAAVR